MASLKLGGEQVLEGKGNRKVEKIVHPYQLNGRYDMKVGKVPTTASFCQVSLRLAMDCLYQNLANKQEHNYILLSGFNYNIVGKLNCYHSPYQIFKNLLVGERRITYFILN